MKTLTINEFFEQFPDDDACIEHLFKLRYGNDFICPKCGVVSKCHKLSGIPAYTCNCGHHIHPMVGTPFENSRTPLQKWFYAIYLFTTSRHGVPAKELQRQLGVTYKCAWRIGHEIRKYMGTVDDGGKLSGHVEADETYIGGHHAGKRGIGAAGKTIVAGIVERDGRIKTEIIPNVRKCTMLTVIEANVEKGSIISTDELNSYKQLSKNGYVHGAVNHSSGQYVRQGKKAFHHTNNVEGFWSQLKRSINGTHIHISKQHMDKYLGEFEYRYNMRKQPELMFDKLIQSF